ncbi:hypothetical protein [Ureibacillus sinduriensis]|uniref:Uncharacterized protein n=1 Tax=Ureibacillus sinduriensis BLB-1 = JCM 15800 TaxID=1384057 RepID=A0A0A3I5I9_9BACL|nr:hypothetical protein [Ureibacillus sinduriensis]KGR77948.1 hypothetical protein CD33_01865 [Ureibacillus sinduriensis BLB-1 = JCM 15800]
MKKMLFYLLYFVVTMLVTYALNWILVLFIGGVRFTAAEGPPGDISLVGKLVFSIGIPVFYFIGLILVFLFYRFLLKQFAIEIHKTIPIIINIVVTIYLIISFSYVVFDLS